jgi:mono/diheme cytochrome c family protein
VSRIAVAIGAALLAAGCGGGKSEQITTSGGSAPVSAAETLFVEKCGTCHTLDEAGTTGTYGVDLDELKPSSAAVLQAVEDGPGTMPPDIVTGDEAQAVADYVARVAGG